MLRIYNCDSSFKIFINTYYTFKRANQRLKRIKHFDLAVSSKKALSVHHMSEISSYI